MRSDICGRCYGTHASAQKVGGATRRPRAMMRAIAPSILFSGGVPCGDRRSPLRRNGPRRLPSSRRAPDRRRGRSCPTALLSSCLVGSEKFASVCRNSITLAPCCKRAQGNAPGFQLSPAKGSVHIMYATETAAQASRCPAPPDGGTRYATSSPPECRSVEQASSRVHPDCKAFGAAEIGRRHRATPSLGGPLGAGVIPALSLPVERHSIRAA